MQTCIKKARFITVLADGSADRSGAVQEPAYIGFVQEGKPIMSAKRAQDVESRTAENIAQGIKTVLEVMGIRLKSSN